MKKIDKKAFLDNVRIASPCSQDWDKMTGDERKRHCELCKLNVYNIKEMSTDEAYDLLANASGRVCVQLYKRRDGTVLTDDCPVGLRRIRNFYRKCAAATIALLAQIGLSAALPANAQLGIPPEADASKKANPDLENFPYKISGGIPVLPNPDKTKVRDKQNPIKRDGLIPPKPAKKKQVYKEPDPPDYILDWAKPQENFVPSAPPVQKETTEETSMKSDFSKNWKITEEANPVQENNRLLAAGLSMMVLAGAFKFIFGSMKKRSSIWIVGCTFGLAFVAVGLIWQWFW